MYLILNFSIAPFFISLQTPETVYKSHTWENPKEGPAEIWDFLKEAETDLESLEWVGGITGPGSFSSLRVNALILETLAQKFKIPLRSSRADEVAKTYLENQKIKIPFCLNAFGDNIFLSHGTGKELELVPLKSLKEKISGSIFTGFLPEEKQKNIPEGISETIEPSLLQDCLARVLNTSPDLKSFVPYYGHAGV